MMKGKPRTFIIAEGGVNHNGSVNTAKKLVKEAKLSGADAIQTFRADKLVSQKLEKAEYQKKTTKSTESQYEMIKRLELGVKEHQELVRYCRSQNIMFLSSPFDEESADLLEKLNVKMFKIGSGEITNLPFLQYVARKDRPMIISTGMATLGEVEEAIDTIVAAGNNNITLLHCVTEYPAPYADINLRAMNTIKEAFGLPFGYSDHTEGIEIAVAAVALGAQFIEKHFTLDRNSEGPDHKSSLEPRMFHEMVIAIRNVEAALGDGRKRPAESELKNIPIARKSVVALHAIKRGQMITKDFVSIKRPGFGIQPKDLNKILGLKARRNISMDQAITWDDLI
jgi:N-acetylneuraminate synthase